MATDNQINEADRDELDKIAAELGVDPEGKNDDELRAACLESARSEQPSDEGSESQEDSGEPAEPESEQPEGEPSERPSDEGAQKPTGPTNAADPDADKDGPYKNEAEKAVDEANGKE